MTSVVMVVLWMAGGHPARVAIAFQNLQMCEAARSSLSDAVRDAPDARVVASGCYLQSVSGGKR